MPRLLLISLEGNDRRADSTRLSGSFRRKDVTTLFAFFTEFTSPSRRNDTICSDPLSSSTGSSLFCSLLSLPLLCLFSCSHRVLADLDSIIFFFSLQCRIGGMDGIFCAYHTTSVMHGFQYIPVDEMDEVLFGSTTMGDQNFALSVEILEKVFETATSLYPGVVSLISSSVSVAREEVEEREEGRDRADFSRLVLFSEPRSDDEDSRRHSRRDGRLRSASGLGRECHGSTEAYYRVEGPSWKQGRREEGCWGSRG